MGFAQGLVDPYLFFQDEVVLVIYVDDCLIFTPKKERADAYTVMIDLRIEQRE